MGSLIQPSMGMALSGRDEGGGLVDWIRYAYLRVKRGRREREPYLRERYNSKDYCPVS